MQATELAPTYRSNPNGDDLDVACALDSQSMADLGHTGIVRAGRPRFARPQHRPFDTTLPDLHPGSWEELQAKLAAARCELVQHESARQAHLQIANRGHQSLLPQPVRHPRIDIDARSLPMDGVGGDYCQVLFPDESCCYCSAPHFLGAETALVMKRVMGGLVAC